MKNIKKDPPVFICVLCGLGFTGYGNNPQPLRMEGRCCSECDMLVISARLDNIKNGKSIYQSI